MFAIGMIIIGRDDNIIYYTLKIVENTNQSSAVTTIIILLIRYSDTASDTYTLIKVETLICRRVVGSNNDNVVTSNV